MNKTKRGFWETNWGCALYMLGLMILMIAVIWVFAGAMTGTLTKEGRERHRAEIAAKEAKERAEFEAFLANLPHEYDEESWDAGYEEGYEEGKRDGYEEGYDDGYDWGYEEGYAEADD